MDPLQLRQNYPSCAYTASHWELREEGLRLSWSFTIGDEHHFHPSLTIPNVTRPQVARLGEATLDWYAFQLGLVELLSYWKTTASPHIEITAGSLSPQEIAWWDSLLKEGLGEFFYQNQLDFTARDFVTWHTAGPTYTPAAATPRLDPHSSPILIPLGGGKDSAVTLKLLGGTLGASILMINPTQASRDIAALRSLPTLEVIRHLDPHLMEMNQAGYLNGHTPFSAMAAWVSTLVAHLFGYGSIAVSNERSSNEGNVTWLGHEINHQYSKTLAFEQAFQRYISDHLEAPIYYSFLRPLYELQIGKLFAKLTMDDNEVRSRFRSCNRGQKTNSWCGDCAKCLFAYLILRPFISHAEMVQMFGRDVLENTRLYPTLLELVGRAESKPFDCVGTHEESLIAAFLSRGAYRAEHLPLPALLAQLDEEVLKAESKLPERSTSILQSWTDDHTLSAELVEILRHALYP